MAVRKGRGIFLGNLDQDDANASSTSSKDGIKAHARAVADLPPSPSAGHAAGARRRLLTYVIPERTGGVKCCGRP
jgi:hypothetical protein